MISMDDFVFNNPTKIVFGRGTENQVGKEVNRYSQKILLHYGGGSIKRSGLYERIVTSLKNANIEYIELAGVQPNPILGLVNQGIELCRRHAVNFILAVGGGSAIDSAKAIAMGVPYEGDVWDFFSGKADLQQALPVGTVLTIPAAGSEASTASVITNEDGLYKRGFNSDLIYPRFSILNPELAFTLPRYQVACGASDIMAHLMERYFTNTKHVELTDRLLEATMKTLIGNAPIVLAQADDYDAWAEVMWTSTIAHNNLLNTGRVGDWGSHDIEHELSGIYDVAHGAGLAVVFPAWQKHVFHHDVQRFAQLAVRVWNVEEDFYDAEKTALAGIAKYEAFIQSLDLPVRLKGLGIGDDRFDEMAAKCTDNDTKTVSNFMKLKKADVLQILKLAL
jgi:alcohol dehydrogenase YqhD (iron-dependent ADH family)